MSRNNRNNRNRAADERVTFAPTACSIPPLAGDEQRAGPAIADWDVPSGLLDDGRVAIAVPVADLGGYATRNLTPTPAAARQLRDVADGLAAAGERAPSGKPIVTSTDALEWIMARVAEARRGAPVPGVA